MVVDNKKNILFLLPGPIYRPDLPNFKDKFEVISDDFEGEIYSWSIDDRFKNYEIGSFVYRGFVDGAQGFLKKVKLAVYVLSNAMRFHKQKKIDAIVCYEPMFTGFIGSVLKIFTRSKLIVEINSERYDGALTAFYGKNFTTLMKTLIFKCLCYWSLFFADAIKVLTEKTKEYLPKSFYEKKIFIFHDFVPTTYFNSKNNIFGRTILFVGYPFKLKGIDILIKAFLQILTKFSDFHLVLIGHELKKGAEQCFSDLSSSIEFYPGLHYDGLRDFFLNCYCFVLPSREEGMGRVLIEAMASGKPVIGSNVGGISSVIEDGRNGFLFESENIDDLADKLDRLLSDPELARRMGDESRKIIDEKFSSKKYVEHFKKMIDEILNGK